MITKEIILKFFRGECTPAEASEIKAYFDATPGSLKEYEDEWNLFEHQQQLPTNISEKIWHFIDKVHSKQKPSFIYYLKRVAIAASVLLTIGVGSYFLFINNGKPEVQKAAVVANMKTITNSTANKMSIELSDGSLVELMPNSTLEYPEKFDSLKRNVVLEGAAFFNVTKDANRSFSVFSGSVETMVLGTKFTVKSYKQQAQTTVILHEGKVAVRLLRKAAKKYILSSGDKFILTKSTSEANIIKAAHRRPSPSSTGKKKSKLGKVPHANNWYMFNNQSLSEVFDQLERIYNTKIIYNSSDLKGKTFIGKVDGADSVETTLNAIALLNDLQIKKENNTYVVKLLQ